jgi:hypothetical protein
MVSHSETAPAGIRHLLNRIRNDKSASIRRRASERTPPVPDQLSDLPGCLLDGWGFRAS